MAARDPETGQFVATGGGAAGIRESLDEADDIIVGRVGNSYADTAAAGDTLVDEIVNFADDVRMMAIEYQLQVRAGTIREGTTPANWLASEVEVALTTGSSHAADGRGNYTLDSIEVGVAFHGANGAASIGPQIQHRKYWIDPLTGADAPEQLSAGTGLNLTSELQSVPTDDSIFYEAIARIFTQEAPS